jgi:hypothetical protein
MSELGTTLRVTDSRRVIGDCGDRVGTRDPVEVGEIARAEARGSGRVRAIRYIVGLGLGFFAVLGGGDFVLSRAAFPHLEGSTDAIRWKRELHESLDPPPDVLFTGCSYELAAIRPAVIDEYVSARTGERLTSINTAASCTSALSAALLVRRVIESDRPPRIVYLGISERNTDAGYDKWMEFGVRALATPADWPLTWRCDAALFAESVASGVFDSYHRWRECRRVATQVFQGAPVVVAADPVIADRGWERFDLHDAAPGRDDPEYRANIADWFSRQPGHYRPGNANDHALRDTIALLRERGITVKLIEMPLTDEVRAMFREDVRTGYESFVRRLTRDTGVALIRAPNGVIDIEDFDDLEHLFPDGADKFSRWLARDVARTWLETGGPEPQSVASASPTGKEH